MANKKISQLVAKTSINSTDLFPIGDATTGTLYKKTIADLQAAIGGAVISVNGLVGTVVLDTDDILEPVSPTNKYFTDARARAAISLTTTGSSGASTYSSSTGVLNVPTYTLAGLGGITATFLSAGTGISYNSGTGVIAYTGTVYTDTSIKALLSATAPLSFNSTTGAFSISQATTSTNGYLSSTDWNTFNGKQNALTNPVTGTSTSGYVAFFNGSTTITGDSAYFWDNTNKRLGIGTNNPGTQLNIVNSAPNSSTLDAIVDISNNIDSNFRILNTGSTATDKRAAIGTSTGTSLAFHTGNAERMRITSAGNVGIGTNSPGYLLTLGNSTGNAVTGTTALAITTNGEYGTTAAKKYLNINFVGYLGEIRSQIQSWDENGDTGNGTLAFNTRIGGILTERIRINYLGYVCVNTTSTLNSDMFMVQMANNTNQTGLGVRALNDGGTASQPAISFYNGTGTLLSRMYADNGTGYFAINTTSSNTERLRIVNSSGNLLLGTTTDNGERLYVSGAIRATGTITANSDISLKKNLAKIENALEKVEQINGYTYEFKEDDSKRHAGVIAQEIQEVLPEIVNKGNDGILGVEYGNISALLIEAIKDLKSQNESLVARLEALEK